MSDLINREAFSRHIINVLGLGDEENGSDPEYMEGLYDCNEALMAFPSADIMECARAIKEYCKKYDEHCAGCPFNSAKPTKWCELASSSFPYEWDLPEGDKE